MGREKSMCYSTEFQFENLPELSEDSASLEDTAVKGRPDLLQYINQRSAIARLIAIEERSLLPEVGVYGQVQHNDRGFFVQGSGDMTAGIYASMPIFDGGQRRAKADEYRAKLKSVDQ